MTISINGIGASGLTQKPYEQIFLKQLQNRLAFLEQAIPYTELTENGIRIVLSLVEFIDAPEKTKSTNTENMDKSFIAYLNLIKAIQPDLLTHIIAETKNTERSDIIGEMICETFADMDYRQKETGEILDRISQLLMDGIDDISELSQIMSLARNLGFRLPQSLEREIVDALAGFLNQMKNSSNIDPEAFKAFLSQVKQIVQDVLDVNETDNLIHSLNASKNEDSQTGLSVANTSYAIQQSLSIGQSTDSGYGPTDPNAEQLNAKVPEISHTETEQEKTENPEIMALISYFQNALEINKSRSHFEYSDKMINGVSAFMVDRLDHISDQFKNDLEKWGKNITGKPKNMPTFEEFAEKFVPPATKSNMPAESQRINPNHIPKQKPTDATTNLDEYGRYRLGDNTIV